MSEQIKIAYMYLEKTRGKPGRLYAVEDVGGRKKEAELYVDGPPRLFTQTIEVLGDGTHNVVFEEVNYR